MEGYNGFVLIRDSAMLPYTESVAEFCMPFSCDNHDLDEFFAKDAFLYNTELLGKTYAWISRDNPKAILGLVTLANDSVKSHNIRRRGVLRTAFVCPMREGVQAAVGVAERFCCYASWAWPRP